MTQGTPTLENYRAMKLWRLEAEERAVKHTWLSLSPPEEHLTPTVLTKTKQLEPLSTGRTEYVVV